MSDADEARLADLRARLLTHRAGRVRPGWDDKVLADWNGLMIAALARASSVFEKPEWLTLAETAFAAVVRDLIGADGRFLHSYRAGQAKAPATASDYANMIWAALRLYQVTGKADYRERAIGWTDILNTHYWDGARGGYFTSADDTSDVIVRLKSAHDDAAPNANAIQLSNLRALATITGNSDYDDLANMLMAAFSGEAARNPVGHCGLLAAGFDTGGLVQVAVISSATKDLKRTLNSLSIPGALEFEDTLQAQGPASAALEGKSAIDGKSTAYVCIGPVCGMPVLEPADLRQRLKEARSKDLLFG